MNTGVFTAPVAGSYFFTFNARARGGDHIHVDLRLNGGQILARTYNLRGDFVLVTHSALKLNEGDRIYASLETGSLYDDSVAHYTQFTGFMLEEDLVF